MKTSQIQSRTSMKVKCNVKKMEKCIKSISPNRFIAHFTCSKLAFMEHPRLEHGTSLEAASPVISHGDITYQPKHISPF